MRLEAVLEYLVVGCMTAKKSYFDRRCVFFFVKSNSNSVCFTAALTVAQVEIKALVPKGYCFHSDMSSFTVMCCPHGTSLENPDLPVYLGR